jgi:hypothetical protein
MHLAEVPVQPLVAVQEPNHVTHQALKKKGMSKTRAAKISNAQAKKS